MSNLTNPNPKLLTRNMQLTIGHLYPKEMNIYGDMGNIITFRKRCEWRNIDIDIIEIGKGYIDSENPNINADLYFMGGGQDNDMYAVFEDLIKYKRKFLLKEVLKEKIFFLICGAFQLFGKYFLDAQGRKIKGLNILPIETKAPSDKLSDRCLGNLASNLSPEIKTMVNNFYKSKFLRTIVGFENHSGQTYFMNNSIKPMAKVIYGKGNNAKEKIDGGVYRNIFGTYSHGSLLPKNPHIADMIITIALQNKYRKTIELAPLDDTIEWMAHQAFLDKITFEKKSEKFFFYQL